MRIIKHCPLIEQNICITTYDLTDKNRYEFWVEAIGDIAAFEGEGYPHEQIEQEAQRLHFERDDRAQLNIFGNPKIGFWINGRHYSGTFSVLYKTGHDGTQYTIITDHGTSIGLTESARRKLAAWFDEIKPELLSPAVLKAEELERIEREIASRTKAIDTFGKEIRLHATQVAQLEDRKRALLHEQAAKLD